MLPEANDYLLGTRAAMGQSTEVVLPHQLPLFPQRPDYLDAVVTWEGTGEKWNHQEHQAKARFQDWGWLSDSLACADSFLEFGEDGTQMRVGNVIVHFKLVVLNVFFLDQQHQDHLGTCYNYNFLCSTSDLLTPEVLGVRPNMYFLCPLKFENLCNP